jgi:lipopolysaccharide biosynthesis glycosyltransferase
MAGSGTVAVLMAFDANYAQHAAACMASLVRHSPARFDFVIASSVDPSGFAGRIRRCFAGNDRVTIEFKHFQVPADTHFPLPYTLTLETYMRFWADELLPGRRLALYLDPDIIVTGPIDDLWRTDLRGNVLAAVPIPNSSRPKTHGMPAGSLFFNAGVLLLDLEAWRSRGYRDRCLEYLRQHPERALDGDQDILNLCTMGDWLPLDYEWNVISPFYRSWHDLGLAESVVLRVRKNARIIHYNGAYKPWTYLDDHPRKADYLQNLALTDWRDWRPTDRTMLNRVRKGLGPWLPRWAKHGGKVLALATGIMREDANRKPTPTHLG